MTSVRRLTHAALSSLILGISLGALAVGSTIGPAAANHSHFRYGHYFWSPGDGTTIDFTLQNAFRRGGYGCLNPTTATTLEQVPCTGPDGRAGIGDVIEEFIGGSVFATGDGTIIGGPTGSLLYQVTSIDPAADSLFALALDPKSLPALDTTISHTYPAPGDYLAFTDSCCRFTHVNNSNGPYRVETLVNVGTGNSSPRSALPPVVQCPINGLCTFTVPVADPDGDGVRFRLSTSQEAGSSQPGPPQAPNAATIDTITGEYRWDTTGAQTSSAGPTLYSTQVTIEDLDASGQRKSKVALDFLIQLIEVVGVEPAFVHPPTPECGSTRTVQVGSTLTFTVEATDPDPGQTVSLNVAGLPPSATMAPELPISGNPVRSSFSWTPTEMEEGTHVVTFTATDSTGRQVLCSVTLSVENEVSIGPGDGNEGAWIPLDAKVTNSSAPTASWSAVPGPDVDPGATCRFSDSPPEFAQLSSLNNLVNQLIGSTGVLPGIGNLFPEPPPSEPGTVRTFINCTDDGEYLVTASFGAAADPGSTSSTTVTVRNVLPTVIIDAPETGTRVALGEAVKVSVLITDPGTNDTHTCTIDWGDGESSAGTLLAVPGAAICEASHTYTVLGEYVITAFVTDDDTPALSSAKVAMSVAPNAGPAGTTTRPPTGPTTQPPIPGLPSAEDVLADVEELLSDLRRASAR